MGSSSKNKGRSPQQDPNAGRKPDAKMTKGPGFKGTNAYYSDKSQVPMAGGLVRPDALPGGIPGGIGLNFYKPDPRDQLAAIQAAQMQGRQNSPSDSRWGYSPMDTGISSQGDRGGTHASGGNWGGIGTAAGNAGRSIGRSTGWW
jgi:hypothetical protein